MLAGDVTAKVCSVCEKRKPPSDFHWVTAVEGACRECSKAISRANKQARYYRDRERIIARVGERKRRQRLTRRLWMAQERERLTTCGLKICCRCHGKKSIRGFGRDAARTDGLNPYCNPCRRAVAAKSRAKHGTGQWTQRHQAIARDYARAAKRDRPCADCGVTGLPPQAMHFHHVDPATKHSSVARLISRAAKIEVLAAEMSKCVLLCANCHAVRHHGQEMI